MNTQPIQPAQLALNPQGRMCSPLHGDDGDPHHAGTAPDFLAASGLPARWRPDPGQDARGPARFTVLDTRFALGHLFLATWQAWRQSPEPKPALDFIALERHPLRQADLQRLQAELQDASLAELAALLQAQWPALTPNLHALSFEQGRVRLLLALGEPRAWLRELVARVDAMAIDEAIDPQACKALARLAAPGATLLARHSAQGMAPMRAALQSSGFELQEADTGSGRTVARHAPRFLPRHAPARFSSPATEHHALIVGAGLAGCATARALARQGWRSTVVDRQAGPAQETSGNPAGLFHGIVHGHDGSHARFGRAAALHSQPLIREALSKHAAGAGGTVMGEMKGLLRLQTEVTDAAEMRATLARLGLPADHVQALAAEEASHLGGLPIRSAAWFYPQGGWVDPGLLCRHWLRESKALFIGGTLVHAIAFAAGRWQALDAQGSCLADAPVLVLANAQHALPLLAPWHAGLDGAVEVVRGQISEIPQAALGSGPVRWPLLPVAGAGYALPGTGSGRLLFGATSQAGDMDPAVRLADHHANLAQLERLLGQTLPPELWSAAPWRGRTGWRCMAPDRLPIAGAVPDEAAWSAMDRPADQPRRVPRRDGLHVCMALGSRGIAWAALAAEVVACGISGAARPLESSLLDAIDPARFLARQARRPG